MEGVTVKPTRSSCRTTAVLDSHGRHPGAAAYVGKTFRVEGFNLVRRLIEFTMPELNFTAP